MERIELAHSAEFNLGLLSVRPQLRQVARDDGASEVLEPRVMQVLVALAQANGAILTRDDLTEACWDGRIVGEDAINRVMSRLRRVAEGIGKDSFKLETITKVGYRLVPRDRPPQPAVEPAEPAPVSPPEASAALPAISAPTQPFARRWIVPAAAILLLLALTIGAALWHRAHRDTPRLVRVEAVDAPSGDASAQLFRQSLSTDLARLVVGNDATLAITDGSAGQKAGDADLRVTGEARSSAGTLHATIRLLGDDGTILWSDDFARPTEELESLRQEVAAKIADVLLCALGAQPGTQSTTLDLQTLRLYLSACEQRHDKWQESAVLFRKVADLQPDFAPAWANLASRTALYAGTLPDPEAAPLFAKAEDYARRALALDPKSGAAYFALAHVHRGMANWIARERIVAQGLAAGAIYAPLYTDAALDMSAIGRNREALDYVRRAVTADPFGRTFASNLAEALANSGHAAESASLFRQADQYWPRDPQVAAMRFEVTARVGDAAQAMKLLADPVVAAGYSPRALADWRLFLAARAAPGSPAVAAAVAALRTGDAGVSQEELADRLIDLVQLGQIDDAFRLADALKPGSANNEGLWFPDMMAPMLADPRFMTIAARHGMATIWLKTGLWPDFCVDRKVRYDCRAEARRALGPAARPLIASGSTGT